MALTSHNQQVDNVTSPRYFVKVFQDLSDPQHPQYQALVLCDSNGNIILPFDNGDVIYVAGVSYTVKKIKIDRATSGELIAAVSSKKLRVISGYYTVASDTTVQLKSATTVSGNFESTGAMTLKSGSGMVLPRDPDGHVETHSGEALNVTLGTACQISGMLKYIEI